MGAGGPSPEFLGEEIIDQRVRIVKISCGACRWTPVGKMTCVQFSPSPPPPISLSLCRSCYYNSNIVAISNKNIATTSIIPLQLPLDIINIARNNLILQIHVCSRPTVRLPMLIYFN